MARVFVQLADTLVDDFDVFEFLHRLTERCTQLLGVDAAGILLTDQHDHLRLIAASSERARLLELFQLQSDQGPCLDAFASGNPVTSTDLPAEAGRWPKFAAAAQRSGFAAVHALPMRLRHQTVGALNLFSARPQALDEETTTFAQAFADIATIGLLHHRAARHQELLSEQLQFALNSRVIIEQAKGMLAERAGISVDEAFTALRDHARRTNTKLPDAATAILNGTSPLGSPTNQDI
ncbi:GAF and ANTAR domain-containing protein [Actinocorallia sp. A-T 12471]|uniref:GAF and ANTAR domain-containing protein n=1 Tax=Actinocorallia sp. A-T 12471 TaxID=3089813 RepID=UPI0029CE5FB3|nr:GAF and ANTAR domain-containing protein [Actinocorallia sp. A-T 12471]MDX6742655.1 GAF and ANTAR domain-containing protein [Actinocorallia sp. A-T 12471]